MINEGLNEPWSVRSFERELYEHVVYMFRHVELNEHLITQVLSIFWAHCI